MPFPPYNRQPMRRFDDRTRGWLLLVGVVAAVFCVGLTLTPWLESRAGAVGSWLRLAYRPTCHQISERCLDLGWGPLAVCARCSGLYAGGLVGLMSGALLGIRIRPRLIWVVLSLTPSAVDFLMALAGLPNLANWPRFLVAVPPGLLFGLLLTDGIGDVIGRIGPNRAIPGADPLQ